MKTAHIYGTKGPRKELRPGDLYVHRQPVRNVYVPRGLVVRIYEGPNEGSKRACPDFHAGWYMQAYLNATHKARAMRDNRPKLVVVSETKIEPQELVEFIDGRDGQRISTRFAPGKVDLSEHGFPQDSYDDVCVPPDSTLTVYDHRGYGGPRQTFGPGRYRLGDFGLQDRVSSFVFALDEWDELGIRLGVERNRKPVGKPIIETVSGTGAEGDSFSKSITLGRERTKGTNWHASASFTASVTFKQGGGPAPGGAEQSFSATAEAGGGGDESKGESRQVSVTVNGLIGESRTIEADAIGQLVEVNQQIFVQLRNKRTGATKEVEGDTAAEKFEVKFSIRHGKVLSHEIKETPNG